MANKPQLYQNWRDLLFLHWEWDADVIQMTLPPGLQVDLFDGKAYLAVVPFTMCDLRPRGFPSAPGVSNFCELNLRTYVIDEKGRNGVWFYSLEADSWISVKIANWFFHLPYRYSKLIREDYDREIYYKAIARRDTERVLMEHRFEKPQNLHTAEEGSLEFFLVERYRLFAYHAKSRKLLTGAITHKPYEIAAAKVDKWTKQMHVLNGFEAPQRDPDFAHYSPGVDVSLFSIEDA